MDQLKTARLLLRLRTISTITTALKEPRQTQMAYFGYQTLEELDRMLPKIQKGLADGYEDLRIFDIIEQESTKVVGTCGFHNWVKKHQRSEMGYELREVFRGRGYMTEVLQKLLPYAFEQLKINRIEALISPSNLKSINLVQRLGFTREGLLRQHVRGNDHFEDSVLYSLLQSDKT